MMVGAEGIEPPTFCTSSRHSNQLSYASKIIGVPWGIRTLDLLLRRQLLYPAELKAHMERMMGIEPTQPAWKAGVLPLNYTRIGAFFQSANIYYHNTTALSTVFLNFLPLDQNLIFIQERRIPLFFSVFRRAPPAIKFLFPSLILTNNTALF